MVFRKLAFAGVPRFLVFFFLAKVKKNGFPEIKQMITICMREREEKEIMRALARVRVYTSVCALFKCDHLSFVEK